MGPINFITIGLQIYNTLYIKQVIFQYYLFLDIILLKPH